MMIDRFASTGRFNVVSQQLAHGPLTIYVRMKRIDRDRFPFGSTGEVNGLNTFFQEIDAQGGFGWVKIVDDPTNPYLYVEVAITKKQNVVDHARPIFIPRKLRSIGRVGAKG